MQFYNSSRDYVRTEDGFLVLETRATETVWEQWDEGSGRVRDFRKPYTSAMVQSWNKFCFTGGVLELSVELPGPWDSAGLWPAAWLMGNLARATFEETTQHVWPWSYDRCDATSPAFLEDKQGISACSDDPGYGLRPGHGRGAPEIDIFEVMPGHTMPDKGFVQGFASTSLQISPGIDKSAKKHHRPQNGYKLNATTVWYEGLREGAGDLNEGFWGQMCGPEKDPTREQRYKYQQDAISINTPLEETHFKQQHIYRLEWQPGDEGYLDWYLDDDFLFGIDDSSLAQRTGATIPFEPMYLIINTAMSHQWGFPEPCKTDACAACYHNYDCSDPAAACALPEGLRGCKNLPAKMKVDFIRLYQDEEDATHTLECSPEKYPTREYIHQNEALFKNWEPTATPHLTWMHFLLINPFGRIIFFTLLAMFISFVLYRINIIHRHMPDWSDFILALHREVSANSPAVDAELSSPGPTVANETTGLLPR